MPALRGSRATFGERIRGTCEVSTLSALWYALCGPIALACLALAFTPRPAAAAPTCFGSIVVADRWDDAAAIPGYAGDARRSLDWRNDGFLDHESFADANGNGLWDPGERFADGNANGRFDSEAYDPQVTGYLPAQRDLGLALALAPAAGGDEGAGHYLVTAGTCDAGGFGADARKASGADLHAIDRALRDVLDADPTAAWDPVLQQITGSTFADGSPRLLFVPFYDPRSFPPDSKAALRVTKVIGLFVEAMTGRATASVRMVPLSAVGIAPLGTAAAGGASPAPVPSAPSWGRIKACYR